MINEKFKPGDAVKVIRRAEEHHLWDTVGCPLPLGSFHVIEEVDSAPCLSKHSGIIYQWTRLKLQGFDRYFGTIWFEKASNVEKLVYIYGRKKCRGIRM